MAARSSHGAPTLPWASAVHVYVGIGALVSPVTQMAFCVHPALNIPLAQT
jgi:hypothetical protein